MHLATNLEDLQTSIAQAGNQAQRRAGTVPGSHNMPKQRWLAIFAFWASPSWTTSLGTEWHSSSKSGFRSLALIFWLRVSSGL